MMARASVTKRGVKRLRSDFTRSISLAKRTLPTGTLIDNVLNYVHAWARLGYVPHVNSPRSLNEHILSSKKRFRGDIDLARRVTDKYLFKQWLQERGHGDLVVPTLGLYNDVSEVKNLVFEKNTILKPTHLSGCAIPFQAPRSLTAEEVRKLEKWIITDYYRKSREKTYKGVMKRLICETLLLDSTDNIPMDYKFFMCRGQPLVIQADIDRFTNHTRQLYSTEWELLDFGWKFPRNPIARDKPTTLDDALNIASTLSEDFPLCRVDLYLLQNDIIKAGEITFSPDGGGGNFSPVSADFALGGKAKSMLESDLGLQS